MSIKFYNIFKMYFICVSGKHISWSVIEDLYHYDSARQTRMHPKLTKKCVYLGGFGDSMRVRPAHVVLSHTSAASIETMVEIKQLTGEARETAMQTAWFCDAMDKLANTFNSASEKPAC